MFRTLLTAAAVSVFAIAAQAAPMPADMIALDSLSAAHVTAPETAQETIQTAAYCEWVTFYDYWGNWQTFWQCY